MSEYAAVYRDGKVHILAEQCDTCIFRPGNLMSLQRGRVRGMVEECVADDGVIPCHCTIRRDDVQPAICRGFYDSRWGQLISTLQIAERLGVIVEDPLPPKEHV